MTISTTIIKNSYSGDGSNTTFTYGFKIADEDFIEVIVKTNATGAESVRSIGTGSTNYAVTGVGEASGGSVIFVTAPTNLETVVLRRSTTQTQALDLIENDNLPANSIENAFDKNLSIIQELQEQLDRSIKISRANTMTSTEFTVSATDRANKILSFNGSGEIAVTQELGTFKGNSATTTTAAFVVRDIVKGTTTAQLNNIYICIQASPVGTALTNTSFWALIVDAVSAATSATAAAASAVDATNNGAAKVTLAEAQVALATTQANNAATSATASASSASTASGHKDTATTKASEAASSATAAASSATSAAASFDSFDDRYLGAKSSDPSSDNDGASLATGALYYNSSTNQFFVYTGSAWSAIKPTSSEQTNIDALAASAVVTDMALLATTDVIADMALLANSDVIADMAILGTSDVVADLNKLATTDIVNDMNTLATTDIVSDLNTLATSDIVSDINTLATSDIVSDLNTLATTDIVSDLNTLATSDFVSDLNAIEGIKANITTVANNVTGVNSFAERYRVGSSDPSSDNDAGDLAYNSTANALKFYNGSAWVAITSGGITDIAQDGTPQLGGDLDTNGNDITSTSNADIDINPNGTGNVVLKTDLVSVGGGSEVGHVSSNGAFDLKLDTNSSTNSGSIVITDGANNDIDITPNGTGKTIFGGTNGIVLPSGTTAQRVNTTGVIRFNTTLGLAEYYDGASYKAIDSAPAVTSINPTSLGQSVLGSSQSIVITGTDFSGVVTVKIIGNDGTEFTPASTTRNSATQITITTPTNLTHTNEPYDIKVINSSNLSGLLANCLSINDTPVFSTGAGSLGTLADGGRAASNLTPIAFTDEESTPTLSVTSGSIPAGLTLNSNGTFSGTANAVSSNATSNFTVTATDGSETATRDYSITVNAPVITFATSAGSIGTINDGDRGSYSFSAVTATVTSGTLSYAIQSGSLPGSLSLNTSTGAISGTLDAVTSDTTSTFTIRATTTSASVTADREFTITVNAPLVLSVSGNIYNGVATNLTVTCTGTDGTVDIVFKEGGTTHSTLSNQSLSSNSITVAVPSAVYGQSTGDTISITVVDGSKTSNAIDKTILGVPTGGSISSSGGYRIHTFTSSGTFTIPSGVSLATEYVVVAGGAGVGSRRHSGGGGAGGYRSSVSGESSGRGASAEGTPTKGAGSYTVTIGGGGSSSSSGSNSNSGANNGSNSVFDNITSNGGGYGGTYNTSGNSGGCGGGSGSEGGSSTSGGSGTSGQGFNGGDGQNNVGGGNGGGGGGAGAVGSTAGGSGGNGGVGVASSITGSSVTRAGGGGGGGGTSNTSGSGGSGGGGNGANSGGSPSSGSGNTGGGAGGGGAEGRSNPTGGSGVVIVRYQL